MRYLIYVPGQHSENQAELLSKVGLASIGRGLDAKVSEGPDGHQGKLMGWLSSTQAQLIYKPETQTWIPSAKAGDRESGAYWVGLWNDSPPTEEDLRKPDHRHGTFVKLGNGERWSIVAPKSLDRFPMLNATGTLTWVVDEAFNWLVSEIDKRRMEAFGTLTDDGTVSISFDFQRDWHVLVSVLQINYRVTPEIVSHLRLFSQQSIKELIATLMDMPLQAV